MMQESESFGYTLWSILLLFLLQASPFFHSSFKMGHNHAVDTNPPVLNGVLANIHITSRGSSWLWACFTIFAIAALLFLFSALRRARTDRIFHYITTAVTVVAAITYFTL